MSGCGWAVGLNDNNAILNSVDVVVEVGVVCFIPEVIPYFSGGWVAGWVAGDVENIATQL